MVNKHSTYNYKKLLEAVKKAQRSLRKILNDSSIKLVVIENCNEHQDIKKAYNQCWKNNDPANWNIYFDALSHQTGNFIVALKQKEKLSGLCFFDAIDISTNAERLRIHAIERNQAHNGLKGFCITAFCEVALEIAKTQNVGRISVLQPQRNTRASYQRLGFTKLNHNEFDLDVDSKTTINWNATFDHQRAKLQPATP